MTPGRWRDWLRGRGRPTASPAGPAEPGGGTGGGSAPGHSSGGDGGTASTLVASDMFTPGRAGGQEVLVWEGAVAAPDSSLAWHSRVPVEVFFHTGYHDSTRELASEFTRQLDRQLSALSLLSAERLLEGIRAYRDQGRQPSPRATRKRRKEFMEQVVDDLVRVHHFSDEEAVARTAEVDRALVVLHEPDQLLAGPGGPATAAQGWPSLGHGQVNSSVGSQNRPMVAVLEQAALQVPPEHRAHVRLLVRAVLTSSPTLAQDLHHGRTHLEPRTQAQVSATSPRAPPWTPTHVAATLATGHAPWNTPPAQEPDQDQPDRAGPTTQPGPTTAGPTQAGAATGQPGHKITREEALASIKAGAAQDSRQDAQPRTARQPRAAREAPTGTGPSRIASLREASFPHPPTAAVGTPPAREGAPPRAGRPGQPSRPLTREEVLADIEARAAQATRQSAQARTPRQTPTRKHRRNRGLGR